MVSAVADDLKEGVLMAVMLVDSGLRRLRNGLGLSLDVVADEMGICKEYVRQFETGYYRFGDARMAKIAEVYGVGTDRIVALFDEAEAECFARKLAVPNVRRDGGKKRAKRVPFIDPTDDCRHDRFRLSLPSNNISRVKITEIMMLMAGNVGGEIRICEQVSKKRRSEDVWTIEAVYRFHFTVVRTGSFGQRIRRSFMYKDVFVMPERFEVIRN